jgi:hypothetical protein
MKYYMANKYVIEVANGYQESYDSAELGVVVGCDSASLTFHWYDDNVYVEAPDDCVLLENCYPILDDDFIATLVADTEHNKEVKTLS